MAARLLLVFYLIVYVQAVRVPTKRYAIEEDSSAQEEEEEELPKFLEEYKQSEGVKEDEESKDNEEKFLPPLYLVPPRQDASNYFKITDKSNEMLQSSWLPLDAKYPEKLTPAVPEVAPSDTLKKSIMPSLELQPPLPDSVPNTDFFTPKPSKEFPLPEMQPSNHKSIMPVLVRNNKPIPMELIPPKHEAYQFKIPTSIYPKKFNKNSAFVPIPIPLAEYEDDKYKTNNVKSHKDAPYDQPKNEEFKKQQKYALVQEKKRFQEDDKKQKFLDSIVAESYTKQNPQNIEEFNDEVDVMHKEGEPALKLAASGDQEGPEDRTEFRMHGLQGPNSYKFGYDTGKGKNRQFRFEERDRDGRVRGHYGYVDHTGKLRVVNYDATPEGGFRAHGPDSEQSDKS